MCDGRSDYSVRVWLDIFATLQWPSTKLVEELKFEVAVQNSASFLIVCPALSEHLKTIPYTKLWDSTTEVEQNVRFIVPFFRGWCIYELFFAMNTEAVTVIIKCGGHHVSESSLPTNMTPHIFKDDPEGIFRIAALIDINRADFSQPSDRDMIFGKAQAYPGGLDGLNMMVKRKLGGSYFSSPYPLIHAFASREDEDIRNRIKTDAEKYILGVAAQGVPALLDEILRSDKSLVRVCDLNDRTPVMAAAAAGHLTCLQILFSYGADLNLVDQSCLSALHYGSIFCNQSSLAFLLDNGADTINSKDKDGMTAAMFAAMAGYMSCIEVLVSRGASVKLSNNVGATALMLAATGGHFYCVQFLVKSGDNNIVNAVDNNGTPALTFAAEGGYLSCVEFLVQSGANVSATRSDNGRTALMLAAQGGHFSCVEFLVKSGANVNDIDSDGATALMLAAMGGHFLCVQFLVTRGANVNAVRADNGMTALMLAAQGGHLSCVEFLVTSGANVNAKNKNRSTALMEAAWKDHLPCVMFLRKHGALVLVFDNDFVSAAGDICVADYESGYYNRTERFLWEYLLYTGACSCCVLSQSGDGDGGYNKALDALRWYYGSCPCTFCCMEFYNWCCCTNCIRCFGAVCHCHKGSLISLFVEGPVTYCHHCVSCFCMSFCCNIFWANYQRTVPAYTRCCCRCLPGVYDLVKDV